MIERRLLLSAAMACLLLLAACAGGPPPPAWQTNAHASLEAYTDAWLHGNDRLAAAAFDSARRELASTGQAEQVAVAELTRCALQIAGVAMLAAPLGDPCPGFAPLAADAGDKARAYADFLAGKKVDTKLLPPQYASFSDAASLQRIDDPLSRLIAAGVLLRKGALPPDGVALAVDTASTQGWRRPLLAWLGIQERLAETRGDKALAEAARKRAALVSGAR